MTYKYTSALLQTWSTLGNYSRKEDTKAANRNQYKNTTEAHTSDFLCVVQWSSPLGYMATTYAYKELAGGCGDETQHRLWEGVYPSSRHTAISTGFPPNYGTDGSSSTRGRGNTEEIQKCPTGKQIQEANHRRVNMLERKKLDTIQHSDDSLAQSTGSFEPRGQYSSFGMSDWMHASLGTTQETASVQSSLPVCHTQNRKTKAFFQSSELSTFTKVL